MTTRRTALITGGGSGIGVAIARHLLDRGWAVTLTGRSESRLEAAAEELGQGDRVLTLSGHAAHDRDVRRWIAETVDVHGGLHAAVANAGFAVPGWLQEGSVDTDGWGEMVLTNVLGPALLLHHAREHLARDGGRIVMVGSVAGLVPTPGNLYGATKYAVTAMAENARRILTDQGVGVTLVSPGKVDSPFWDELGGPPHAPMLTPDDIGRAIAWALEQPPGVDVSSLTVRPFHSPN